MTVLLLLLVALGSCNTPEKRGIDMLIQKWSTAPNDTLKLACARFIKENMTDQSGEKLVFYNIRTKEEVDIRLDTITNEHSLNDILLSHNLTFRSICMPDSITANAAFIEQNINNAIDDWQRYPWNKKVPFDVFLNFLLPYKVMNEYPENWRGFFHNMYRDSLAQYAKVYLSGSPDKRYEMTDELYYSILVGNVGKWFSYNPGYTKLTNTASLSEMMCIREGDCFNWSYLNVYILRSLGIPATIDAVPLWGSKNGGHASDVFYHENGKLEPADGRKFERPAKVIRWSFKRKNVWTDSIKPVIGHDLFLLSELQHDHWYDVTDEYTRTANIAYQLPLEKRKGRYAYICVYNYGAWQPVFYGVIDTCGSALFRNMGCDMLYRIGVPRGNNFELLDDLFLVDSSGERRALPNPAPQRASLSLQKVNSGSGAFVKKGRFYELQGLDMKKHWRSLGTKMCDQDSVILFKNVAACSLYQLADMGSRKRLERIFSYKDGLQKWW